MSTLSELPYTERSSPRTPSSTMSGSTIAQDGATTGSGGSKVTLKTESRSTIRQGWAGWMAEDLSTASMVPTLILQAFATGVLDATTYADFLTFASNQTGNTILLCVAAIGYANATNEIRLVLTAVSLGSFLVCAGVFGHLGHFMGTHRRSWLLFTNIVQLLILATALLLLTIPSLSIFHVGGNHEWLPLALFAGMSGAQVVQARQSGSAEVPTAPMTSSYVDLVSDPHLFRSIRDARAAPRNKRAAYIGVMVAGGMVGAVIHRWAGTGAVVGVTLGLKAVATVWIALLRGEQAQRPAARIDAAVCMEEKV